MSCKCLFSEGNIKGKGSKECWKFNKIDHRISVLFEIRENGCFPKFQIKSDGVLTFVGRCLKRDMKNGRWFPRPVSFASSKTLHFIELGQILSMLILQVLF